MKKPFYFWLAVVATLLVFGSLIWAFSQHGTIGLFRVNGTFKMMFIAVAVAGCLPVFFAWLAGRLKTRGRARLSRWLAVVATVICLPALLGAPAGWIVLGGLDSPGIGDTPPQLMIVGTAGSGSVPDLAVTFNTRAATVNSLGWGKAGAAGTTLTEDQALKQHAFILTGLEPAARYWYRLNGGQSVAFSTPPAGGRLHFAVGSDAHFGSATSRGDLTALMLAAIAAPGHNFDALFNIGDLVQWGFAAGQWQQAFTAFSAATGTIPVRYLPGNHDMLFAGTKYYESYAAPQGLADSGSPLWSRIDMGNIHFLCLDLEWSAESFNRAQADWLEAQLRSIPVGDWKIVLGHGFYYASGYTTEGWNWYDNPETIGKLTPLFEKYGVDLVFSGHNHQMELLQKSGVTYAICGGFGGLPDNQRTYRSPYSLWYAGGQYGFMDVTLDGSQADIVFRGPDYAPIFSYQLTKQ